MFKKVKHGKRQFWPALSGAVIFLAVFVLLQISGKLEALMAKEPANFNFVFRYGVQAKNVLDTHKVTYTKDMIMDAPLVIPLALSTADLHKIYQKMIEIDFFNYPEKYAAPSPTGHGVTPCDSYYFEVTNGPQTKKVTWDDCEMDRSSKAVKLRDLVGLIKGIIQARPEYQALPEARGGYVMRPVRIAARGGN